MDVPWLDLYVLEQTIVNDLGRDSTTIDLSWFETRLKG